MPGIPNTTLTLFAMSESTIISPPDFNPILKKYLFDYGRNFKALTLCDALSALKTSAYLTPH